MEFSAAVALRDARRRTSERRRLAAKVCAAAAAGMAVLGLAPAFCAPALGAGSAVTIDGAMRVGPPAAVRTKADGATFSTSTGAGAAAAFAVAAAFLASHRRESPVQAKYSIGWLPVRQWAPELIPASERRNPEDRIRLKLRASDPYVLRESVEVLEDFAKEMGADTEGPVIMAKKRIHWYANKGPKGHKRAKTHWNLEEHVWIFDLYPPVGGNFDAVIKVKLPHTVQIQIS